MRHLTLALLCAGAGCSIWIGKDDQAAWTCEYWLAQGPWYLDEDGDGVGGAEATLQDCPDRDIAITESGDCDDHDPDRFPGNPELCQDGVDQDCDDVDPQRLTWYADVDEDGYGDDDSVLEACDQPEGTVTVGGDCDDQDADSNPGEPDPTCSDGVDQDCDGLADCALSGDVDLSSGWSDYGLARTYAVGTPVAMASGRDVDGDGVDDLAISGDDVAFLLTVGSDRDDESSRLDPSFPEDDDNGLAVALASSPDGVALVVSAPGWSAEDALGTGRIALMWNGDQDSIGWMVVPTTENVLGRSMASLGDTLAVTLTVPRDAPLEPDHTWAHVLSGSALPGPGETLRMDRAVEDATVEVESTLSYRWPHLTLATSDAGLELAVVNTPGHLDDTTDNYWFAPPIEGEIELSAAVLSQSSDDEKSGRSCALVDLDGDGANDLVLGRPGDDEVQIYAGPAAEGSADPSQYLHATAAGMALAKGGDMDGDGLDDLLVGAPDADTVYEVLGGQGTTRVELDYAAKIVGTEASALGTSLVGADLDGDGWSDLVAGAPESGSIYLLWGGP